ncbi:MAG TPA: hypothetical protein VK766_11740 [Cytophagaceae bacterium]|jgi:hypothetical protein|nr:hypothetical protein [Cytophagaceae bacterium]
MKNKNIQVAFFFLISILISCKEQVNENEDKQVSLHDTLFTAIPKTIFTGIYDTLGYSISVNSISKEQYESVSVAIPNDDSTRIALCGEKEGGCMEAMERYYISKVSEQVQRKGKELILRLSNGQTKKFTNDTSQSDGYEVYQFLSMDKNGYYIVAVFYFESYNYLLINARNGHATRTIGYPVFSPNRSLYVAGNYDMVASFTFNGIDFIGVTKDSTFSEACIDFSTWGPDELKWKDDSTLYIKQKSQTGENLIERINYAAMRFRRKYSI